MNKLKLKTLKLGASELLTRTQLKNISGGSGGSDSCADECTNSSQCINTKLCTEVDCMGVSPTKKYHICA